VASLCGLLAQQEAAALLLHRGEAPPQLSRLRVVGGPLSSPPVVALARQHVQDPLPPAPAPAPEGPTTTMPVIPPAATPPTTTLPPPPPPPEPLPPNLPVMTDVECKLLQDAMIVSPPASCSHRQFTSNWDGCTCAIVMPPTMKPMPDNLFNPFAQEIVPDPNAPTLAPMGTVPPPSNPAQPFNPPVVPPVCPFHSSVPPGFDGVGFNSWGFSETDMATYSPAAAHLNMISCSYIMKPYSRFVVPPKINAFWALRAKRGEVVGHYGTTLNVACEGDGSNDESYEWGAWCTNKVHGEQTSCDAKWETLFTGSCASAAAPEGFDKKSMLGSFCPFECGFIKGELTWPYPLPEEDPTAEAAEEAADEAALAAV